MDDTERRDLDETRRLLYMALAAPHTDRYDLAGTLTNALAHHGGGVDPEEALGQVLAAIDGGPAGATWVRDQIASINRRAAAPE